MSTQGGGAPYSVLRTFRSGGFSIATKAFSGNKSNSENVVSCLAQEFVVRFLDCLERQNGGKSSGPYQTG